ncbi:MAG TPA: ergothioneine biosynthesis glutamate--cysteine ligase EgtA [Streptosporangiaceae bacterium]|nr:ergothioneine biosynthesis glutamate--cysteine ligase EgtA [Streptosporangiaceae bacterium]
MIGAYDHDFRVDATPLTEQAAVAHIHGICFKTGPPERVGVELEWLVRDARDPALPVEPDRVESALADLGSPGALPARGCLTTEPGGQLELSSLPAASIGDCIADAARDMAAVTEAMHEAGLCLSGHGLDPFRPPLRVLDSPRYAAMEEFFDRSGRAGRIMMCSTASVQVCLDAGEEGPGQQGYCRRWHLLHKIGPVLVAAFANSPLVQGRPTGWRSTRQAVWAQLDPGRTRPPQENGRPGMSSDLRSRWAHYALDSELMCVRRPDNESWVAPPGLTFRDWLRGADAAGFRGSHGIASARVDGERRPTVDDLEYHLSTLFPPVRPRGHIELRMIDAQSGDGWVVPTAVAWALVSDAQAADVAFAAVEPLWNAPGDPWLRAARHGPADGAVARAVRECFEAADAALRRSAAPATLLRSVTNFTERYVERDRCPADDLLKELP